MEKYLFTTVYGWNFTGKLRNTKRKQYPAVAIWNLSNHIKDECKRELQVCNTHWHTAGNVWKAANGLQQMREDNLTIKDGKSKKGVIV